MEGMRGLRADERVRGDAAVAGEKRTREGFEGEVLGEEGRSGQSRASLFATEGELKDRFSTPVRTQGEFSCADAVRRVFRAVMGEPRGTSGVFRCALRKEGDLSRRERAKCDPLVGARVSAREER